MVASAAEKEQTTVREVIGPLLCSFVAGQGVRAYLPPEWGCSRCMIAFLTHVSGTWMIVYMVFVFAKVVKLIWPHFCLSDIGDHLSDIAFCDRHEQDHISYLPRMEKVFTYVGLFVFYLVSWCFSRSKAYRSRVKQLPKLGREMDELIEKIRERKKTGKASDGSGELRTLLKSGCRTCLDCDSEAPADSATGDGTAAGSEAAVDSNGDGQPKPEDKQQQREPVKDWIRQTLESKLLYLTFRADLLGYKEFVLGLIFGFVVLYLRRRDLAGKTLDETDRTAALNALAVWIFICATMPLAAMVQFASLKVHCFWFEVAKPILCDELDELSRSRNTSMDSAAESSPGTAASHQNSIGSGFFWVAASSLGGACAQVQSPAERNVMLCLSEESCQLRCHFAERTKAYTRLVRELQEVSNDSRLIFVGFQLVCLVVIVGRGLLAWYHQISVSLVVNGMGLLVGWAFFMLTFVTLSSVTKYHAEHTCVRLWELSTVDGEVGPPHPMSDFVDVVRGFPTGWTEFCQILTMEKLMYLASVGLANYGVRGLYYLYHANSPHNKTA